MKKLFFVLAVLVCSSKMYSQKVFINVFSGIANYKGDLNYNPSGGKQFSFKEPGFAEGLGLEYEISDKFNIRLGAALAKINADDKKQPGQQQRNLNFTSNIFDAMIGLQYYITNPAEHFLNPYIFAGVAYFHYNPYTYDSLHQKVFLKPLSTEGESFVTGKKNYNLSQIAIPFGGGVKFSLSQNLRVGFEVSIRKTFTDYLDDVSGTYVDQNLLIANRGQQAADLAYRGDELKNGGTYPAAGTLRGTTIGKDWYYFTGLTLSFRLVGGAERTASANNNTFKRKVGCPRAF